MNNYTEDEKLGMLEAFLNQKREQKQYQEKYRKSDKGKKNNV